MGGTFSSGENNGDLVNILLLLGYVKTQRVERALRAVDRGFYVPPSELSVAYKDLSIKVGNIHISAPCVYCHVMEGLDFKPGMSFLNIGSGTGYLSTMAGLILGRNGTNHGIELHEDCVKYAHQKLEKFKRRYLDPDNFEFCEPIFTIGNILDVEPGRQYDRVYCGADCPASHEQFIKQFVKIGGILVMPYNDNLLRLQRVGRKTWNTISLLPVSFNSLIIPPEGAKRSRAYLPPCQPKGLQELCRSRIRLHLRSLIAPEKEGSKPCRKQGPRPEFRRAAGPPPPSRGTGSLRSSGHNPILNPTRRNPGTIGRPFSVRRALPDPVDDEELIERERAGLREMRRLYEQDIRSSATFQTTRWRCPSTFREASNPTPMRSNDSPTASTSQDVEMEDCQGNRTTSRIIHSSAKRVNDDTEQSGPVDVLRYRLLVTHEKSGKTCSVIGPLSDDDTPSTSSMTHVDVQKTDSNESVGDVLVEEKNEDTTKCSDNEPQTLQTLPGGPNENSFTDVEDNSQHSIKLVDYDSDEDEKPDNEPRRLPSKPRRPQFAQLYRGGARKPRKLQIKNLRPIQAVQDSVEDKGNASNSRERQGNEPQSLQNQNICPVNAVQDSIEDDGNSSNSSELQGNEPQRLHTQNILPVEAVQNSVEDEGNASNSRDSQGNEPRRLETQNVSPVEAMEDSVDDAGNSSNIVESQSNEPPSMQTETISAVEAMEDSVDNAGSSSNLVESQGNEPPSMQTENIRAVEAMEDSVDDAGSSSNLVESQGNEPPSMQTENISAVEGMEDSVADEENASNSVESQGNEPQNMQSQNIPPVEAVQDSDKNARHPSSSPESQGNEPQSMQTEQISHIVRPFQKLFNLYDKYNGKNIEDFNFVEVVNEDPNRPDNEPRSKEDERPVQNVINFGEDQVNSVQLVSNEGSVEIAAKDEGNSSNKSESRGNKPSAMQIPYIARVKTVQDSVNDAGNSSNRSESQGNEPQRAPTSRQNAGTVASHSRSGANRTRRGNRSNSARIPVERIPDEEDEEEPLDESILRANDEFAERAAGRNSTGGGGRLRRYCPAKPTNVEIHRRNLKRNCMAWKEQKEKVATFMQKSIHALPLPQKLRSYLNYDRE